MAQIKKPPKALLFFAVMYPDRESYESAKAILEKKFGPVHMESDEFDFTKFSKYYEPEMGKKLRKRYVVMKEPIDREKLAEIRLFTQGLEEKLSKNKKRTANIDPGYITKEAIVLATLKEKGHKVYLGKGVFADMQTLFRKNGLKTFEWTFADLNANSKFFVEVRSNILKNRMF